MNTCHNIIDPARLFPSRMYSRPIRFILLFCITLLLIAPPAHAKKVLQDGTGEDPDVQENIEEAQDAVDEADLPDRADATATISGSVFYNDRRTHGLFASRNDLSGDPGERCDKDGERDDGSTPCSLNWLAGRYMVVDIIERDKDFSAGESDCKGEDVIGKATVKADGSFSAVITAYDPCGSDTLPDSAIQVRVRLRFCNSKYCFSMNDKDGDTYRLSHPMASKSNPLRVKDGDDINLKWMPFKKNDDGAKPDNYSLAANNYASVVDTVLTWHKDHDVPFYSEEFGEIRYFFPAEANPYGSPRHKSSTATTFTPTEIVISNFESRKDGSFVWLPGDTPAHEYGHILMQRAWDGSYGFDGVGNSANDSEKAESRQIAFKEAWAEFTSHAALDETRGCARRSFDDTETTIDCPAIAADIRQLKSDRRDQHVIMGSLQGAGLEAATERLAQIDADIAAQEEALAACQVDNRTTSLNGPLGEGAQWRGNVTHALCDWYDTRNDDDTTLPGPGDDFTENDLYAIWYNLRRMYVDAEKYGGEFKKPGLWLCDYVDYYLNVRNAPSEVGQAQHAARVEKVRDLLYNNAIGCYLPPPA